MYRQFLWSGTLTGKAVRAHKVSSDVVHLPKKDLGVGVIDYKARMISQAAQAVVEWNSRKHDKVWAAYNLLLQPLGRQQNVHAIHTFPSPKEVTNAAIDGPTTIHRIGYDSVNEALARCCHHPAGLRSAKADAPQTMRPPHMGLRFSNWHDHAAGGGSGPVVGA